jgi:hypothetical protein
MPHPKRARTQAASEEKHPLVALQLALGAQDAARQQERKQQLILLEQRPAATVVMLSQPKC